MENDPFLKRQVLRRLTESDIFMRTWVGMMALMSLMTQSKEFRFITAGLAVFLMIEKAQLSKVDSGTENFEYPPEIE